MLLLASRYSLRMYEIFPLGKTMYGYYVKIKKSKACDITSIDIELRCEEG